MQKFGVVTPAPKNYVPPKRVYPKKEKDGNMKAILLAALGGKRLIK